MKKMTDILSKVDVRVQPLNSELIYLTENEKQVGSLILIYSGDDASIFSVQVLDNHRGKGYGKKLVEKAINICKTKGFKKIELNTEQDNQVANSMYRKMGFKLEGLKDNFNKYSVLIQDKNNFYSEDIMNEIYDTAEKVKVIFIVIKKEIEKCKKYY